MRLGILCGLCLWVIIFACGCSAKIEVGYHGKTGIDRQEVTPELVTVKGRRERY